MAWTKEVGKSAKQNGDYAKSQGDYAKQVATTIETDNNNRLSIGAYNAATQYKKYNEVTYNGSTWRALRDVKGVAPVEGLDWTMTASRGLDGTGVTKEYHQQFIATANQKVFTLSGSYNIIDNPTSVYVCGIPQYAPNNYTKTTTNSITFSEGIEAGIVVDIVVIYQV